MNFWHQRCFLQPGSCTSGCITWFAASRVWAAEKPRAAVLHGLLLGKPRQAVQQSSETIQGSGFGVFLLVCQQAGMCKREAAHFQGLC